MAALSRRPIVVGPVASPGPPVPGVRTFDQRVNAIGRRARDFRPYFMQVFERGAGGPVQLAGFNPNRISLWVKAPKLNTSVIYLGDASVTGDLSTPITGGWLAGHSWELEPGEALIIDDTFAAIFAVAQVGQGTMLVKAVEMTDPGPNTQ